MCYSIAVDLITAIWQLLFDVRAWIRDIQHTIRERSEPQDVREEGKRNKQFPPDKVRAVVSFDDETIGRSQAEEGRKQATQESIKNAAWSAFGAATIYALISMLIWCQMIKQNRIATQALEVANRPWVSAAISMKSPLAFGPAGASTTVSFYLKNDGHTPAIGTRYHASIVTLPEKTWSAVELRNAIKSECTSMDKYFFVGTPNIFPTLFPGDETSRDWPADISHAGILDGLKITDSGPMQHKGFVRLYVVACVDYQLSFQSDHHQTAYGVQLGAPRPNTGIWMGDIQPEGIHPEVKMVLLDTFAN
jgi:hypothetical protein